MKVINTWVVMKDSVLTELYEVSGDTFYIKAAGLIRSIDASTARVLIHSVAYGQQVVSDVHR